MKGIYLIAIAIVFLASWSVINAEEEEFDKEIPTKCPAKDPKNTTIHIAHESDCTKFYMCHAGKKILRQCPYMNNKGDRLHFNPYLQVCDWPYRAGCKKKQDQDKVLNVQFIEEEEHHEPFLTDKIPTKCPAKDPKNTTILLPHESDCTKFYMCHAGKKILRQCPYMNNKSDKLHFNPYLQVCDWPWHAGCKHKSSDKNHVATSKEIVAKKNHNRVVRATSTDNKCPDRNPGNTTILLPHEYDCTKFYICLGREKIEQDCPYMNQKGDRLHFNPKLKACDWPDMAGCYDEGQAEVTEPPISGEKDKSWEDESWEDGSWEDGKIHTKCPAKDPKNTTIHIPHEYDCTKFYMCQGGRKILRQCPYMNKHGDRLHFNPRLQVCDWPDRAGCWSDGTTHYPTRSTRSTWYTHHTDHTRSTTPTWPTRHTDHTRSTDSTWHTHHTDHTRSTTPWPTRHTDHTRTTESTWPTRPPPGECRWDGFLLRHECNCSMFYECVNGNKVLRECPDGLYFSEKYQGCGKIEDSVCKNKKPPPKCEWEGELIPHECDCNKYYLCRKDGQVLRWCEDGLDFSPERRRCEDPDTAGCRDGGDGHHSGDCPKPTPEHPWRHECDCRLFYKCENGKKHLYECPWGYYFDQKKDGCVRQEHVTDCKNWDD